MTLIKILLSFSLVFILTGFSKKPIKTEDPISSPSIAEPTKKINIDDIHSFVLSNECSKFSYGGGQGRAPASYLKGITLTYVKTLCSKESDVYRIGSQPNGPTSKDALSHYGVYPSTPEKRLSTTFALMIGSNARESSWRPCVGRDVGAKSSDVQGCLYGSGSTCEAGLSQTSYNSVPKEGPLRDLFNSFLNDSSTCFKSEYYGKITCSESNWKNHGSDPKAVAYQKLSKECPAFSVESAAIMFRTARSHYYPLNSKKAEIVPSCVLMFEKIVKMVESSPEICTQFK